MIMARMTARVRVVLAPLAGAAVLTAGISGPGLAQSDEATGAAFLAEIATCYVPPQDRPEDTDRIELTARFESDGYVYERPGLITPRLETPGQRALLRATVDALRSCGQWAALEDPAARTEMHLAVDPRGFEIIAVIVLDPDAIHAPDTAAAGPAPAAEVPEQSAAEVAPSTAEAIAETPEAAAGAALKAEVAAANAVAGADGGGGLALGSTETYSPKVVAIPAGEAEDGWRLLGAFPANEEDEASLGLSRDKRREIQRRLTLLDHDTRGVDGIFGEGTREAISDWQAAESLSPTGFMSGPQVELLNILSHTAYAEWQSEQPKRTANRNSTRARAYRGSDGCLRNKSDNKRNSIIVGRSVYCDLRKIGLR